MKLSKEKKQKRLELYKKGLSDSEIADVLGLNDHVIGYWRKRNDLESNFKIEKLSQKIKDKIEKLYNKGMNDSKIADKLDISTGAVQQYRTRNNLPTHNKTANPLKEEKHQKRMKLYKKGLSDTEIAEKVGLSKNGIASWRYRNKLPANHKYKLTEKEEKRRMKLYEKGLNDEELAEKLDLSVSGIVHWRIKNNLKANPK